MTLRISTLLAAAFVFGLMTAATSEATAWAGSDSPVIATPTPTAKKRSRVAQASKKRASGKRAVKSKARSKKSKKKAKVKNVIFGVGDELEGELLRPDTDTVTARRDLEHDSLIRLRRHFLPEIHKSAETL